jgi:hypothetical protein
MFLITGKKALVELAENSYLLIGKSEEVFLEIHICLSFKKPPFQALINSIFHVKNKKTNFLWYFHRNVCKEFLKVSGNLLNRKTKI